MKSISRIFLVLAGIAISVLVIVLGIRAMNGSTRRPDSTSAQPNSTSPLTGTAAGSLTPADRQIRASQGVIERTPDSPKGYNLLSSAYMQKARETGDFSYNAKAQAALNRSLEVAPDNFDAISLHAKLLLTYHRFSDALEAARRAQAIQPENHDIYGALTDALVELGDYKEAVEAAQRMVDLRPETSSYSRVSYLRALHGDTNGAIEAMRLAADSANPQNPENVAWCRVQLGNELMNAGKLDEGEREFDHALYVFPDYHAALAAKGRARLAANDMNGAIEFYKRAQERVPLPEYAVALGDLYTKLGRADEAKQQYALVEYIERTGAIEGTYSRQLALFWADHDLRLDDALAAAQRERSARKDIYTCDVLAWCLYKKGQLDEAKTSMDEALRLGTRDARLLYHAGMIANARGERGAAAKYLKEALSIDPSFDVLQADVARRTVASIKH